VIVWGQINGKLEMSVGLEAMEKKIESCRIFPMKPSQLKCSNTLGTTRSEKKVVDPYASIIQLPEPETPILHATFQHFIKIP